jgi:DNA-binding response OmpR family regulator
VAVRQEQLRAIRLMERILIVGDHPGEVLELVGHVLEQVGYKVRILDRRECNGNRIRGQGPDLLVLDASSRGFDVAGVCSQVRSQRCFARLPILVLSAAGADLKLVSSHINGVVERPVKPNLLISCVRELLDREQPENPEKQICVDDLVIDPVMHRATRDGASLSLTALEFRLLYYLASRANTVCRRDELVLAVWDDPKTIPRSVDVAVRHLRTKIEKDPQKPVWIRVVYRRGYTFNIPE